MDTSALYVLLVTATKVTGILALLLQAAIPATADKATARNATFLNTFIIFLLLVKKICCLHIRRKKNNYFYLGKDSYNKGLKKPLWDESDIFGTKDNY